MKIVKGNITDKEEGFKRGRGYVDLIFTLEIVVEKHQERGKYRKHFASFINLEKAYDIVNWKDLWDVLKICVGGGHLLVGNKNVSVPVHMSGEQSESFGVGVM